jgi:hypothetical protein
VDLEHKPDFAAAAARLDAWWHGRIIDRPPVTLDVRPNQPPAMPAPHASDPRRRWFDVDYAVDCAEASIRGGVFLAERFPCFEPNDNPEVAATVFGADLEFTPHGSYAKSFAASCHEVMELRADLDTPYWQRLRAVVDLSLERGRGRWITCMPNFSTGGDLLGALRGPEPLCLDLAENLAAVRAADGHVSSVFAAQFDEMWTRLRDAGQPCCTAWTPLLHAGPAYPVACDFMGMISPRMFAEAFLPTLSLQAARLERSLFHMDGPRALHHLDAVLALPHLNAVSWIYGPGDAPAARWIDVYKRIQAAGKAVQLVTNNLADAQAVAAHLRPEGVWFCPAGTYSREDAEDFIAWTARWAASKP